MNTIVALRRQQLECVRMDLGDATDTPSDLVNVKAVARMFDVHVGTVHRWIQRGKLKAWRLAGEHYLVSESEARSLLVPVVLPAKQNGESPADDA